MSVIIECNVYVDWDNDGDFNDANENITDYVEFISWMIGQDPPPDHPVAGRCTVRLNNSSAIFSSFNANSVLYGSTLPGRKVRITMCSEGGSSGEEVSEWQGQLEKLEPEVSLVKGANKAYLTAFGILSQLQNVDIDLALQENVTTGSVIGSLLTQAGFPGADREIDAGQTTLYKYWLPKGSKAQPAIFEMMDAELGRIFEGTEGEFIFRGRDYYFSSPGDTPQATYGDGTLHMWNAKQLDPLRGIYNSVHAKNRTFNKSDTITLATLTDLENSIGGIPIIVPAGDTKTVIIDFNEISHPTNQIGVLSWGTVGYEANTAADGSGSGITSDVDAAATSYGARQQIIFTNNTSVDAHMILIRAKGVALIESDPIVLSADDSTSQAKYRIREYPYPSNWNTDPEDTQDYCDHVVLTHKDPRPRLYFEVIANFDEAHFIEARDRRVGDRIEIVADSDWGLGIDGEFIIDKIEHIHNNKYKHVMHVWCTIAPTEELGALSTTYTQKVEVPVIPSSNLKLYPYPVGLYMVVGCVATTDNEGIEEAEFRAMYYADGSKPSYADLRTSVEGGTFSHNGTTQLIVTGLAANEFGTVYTWLSGSAGFWFFAFRMKRANGEWSNWSDGNATPKYVVDNIHTESATRADTAPPDTWTVTRELGPSSTIIGKVTRPENYGNRIIGISWIMRDSSLSASPDPVLPDSNTAPAVTHYDGSAISHVYSKTSSTGFRITRDDSNVGFDDAVVGDLVMIDVRGNGNYNSKYTFWDIVDAFENDDAATASWFTLRNAAILPVAGADIRLKIVKPPWAWTTGGYQGAAGYVEDAFYEDKNADGTIGDLATMLFSSVPIEIPSGVDADDLEVTAFIRTAYSISNDDEYSDPDEVAPDIDSFCITLTDGTTINTNAILARGKVCRVNMTETFSANRLLANVTNSLCGEEIIWTFLNNTGADVTIELDDEYRNGRIAPEYLEDSITTGLRIVEDDSGGTLVLFIEDGTQAYLGVRRESSDEKFDVQFFRYGYVIPVTIPPAWGYWDMDETEGNDRTDGSGNSRDMSEIDDPVPDGSASKSQTSGKLSGCAYFTGDNGVTENLATDDVCPDLTGNEVFTFVFWLYVHINANPASYCDLYVNMGAGLDVGCNVRVNDGDSGAQIYAFTDDLSCTSAADSVSADAWHMITVEFTGSALNVYIDDNTTPIATDAGTSGVDYAAGSVSFGGVYPDSEVEYYIDEAGYWVGDNALNEAQRLMLYNSGAGMNPYA